MISIILTEMTSDTNRYVVGFLLAVGLIIVVIILIVRGLVGSPSSAPVVPKSLTDYLGTSTAMQFTIDSPVTAAQNHNDIIINVSNYQATLTVTQGYEGQVIKSQGYPMSSNAYGIFLRALNFNGFTQGNNDPALKDERGRCALGDRFMYEIIDGNGDDIQRYWYTSCNSGTFEGDVHVIRQLFVNQIPDYNELTANIRL